MYFTNLILMGHLEPEQIAAYIDSGIEAFSEELAAIHSENLGIERSFIAEADEPARSRYLTIWTDEIGFIASDLERRIEWLKELRGEIAA